MAPAWLKIVLFGCLLLLVGVLVFVILHGLGYDIRYTRLRVREHLSPADRRIFWVWAFAFPIVIAIGTVVGVALHLGSDYIASALAGGGFAGGVMILITWLLGGHFVYKDPQKPRE